MRLIKAKFILIASLGPISLAVFADCKHSLPLSGSVSIAGCDPKTQECLPVQSTLHAYTENIKDEVGAISVVIHASPWRLYGERFRIMTTDELAEDLRKELAKNKSAKRIDLMASWSAVRPSAEVPAIAEKLSKNLGGVPVAGAKGFLWVGPEGKTRTTRQATTVYSGTGYYVAKGSEIMASAAVAWALKGVDKSRERRDAAGLMLAGAAADIFSLCPENALALFEAAAELGEPVAAYNAALMRLESGTKPDMDRAAALLSKAARAGDAKAQQRLRALRPGGAQ